LRGWQHIPHRFRVSRWDVQPGWGDGVHTLQRGAVWRRLGVVHSGVLRGMHRGLRVRHWFGVCDSGGLSSRCVQPGRVERVQSVPSGCLRQQQCAEHRCMHWPLPCGTVWRHSGTGHGSMCRALQCGLRVSGWQHVAHCHVVSGWDVQLGGCQQLHPVPRWHVWCDAWTDFGCMQWPVHDRVRVSPGLHRRRYVGVSCRDLQPGGRQQLYQLQCGAVRGGVGHDDCSVQRAVSSRSIRERTRPVHPRLFGQLHCGVRVSRGVHQRHRVLVCCRVLQPAGRGQLHPVSRRGLWVCARPDHRGVHRPLSRRPVRKRVWRCLADVCGWL
jgi:hypothetical protein